MRKNMVFFILTAIFALSNILGSAIASGAETYTVLPVPLSTNSGSKIEVAEFFWYGCPHCFNLEPSLNQWLKTVPKNVAIRRIPAVLNDAWADQAKVWYTMKDLGVAEKYHDDFFNAIHLDGLNFRSEISVFNWAGKMGINQQAFANDYHSFGVQSQVARAAQLTREAHITGVPAFVVDGKYVTSEAIAGSETALFTTLNQLIALSKKSHAHSTP